MAKYNIYDGENWIEYLFDPAAHVHAATDITQTSSYRFVTDAEKTTWNAKQSALTNPVTGTGTASTLAYWNGTGTIASLATATYPSLTEIGYVKGVTSAIQSQISGKAASVHAHGNIGTGGTITSAVVTAATDDCILISDASNSGKIERGLAFNTTHGNAFLRKDGSWAVPPDTTYSLPLSASGTRGGVKIGYTTNGKNYAVQLSSEQMYVNVPWIDTIFTTVAAGLVPASGIVGTTKYLRQDGTWAVPPDNYLSTNGGTVSGDITLSPSGTAQADQKAIKWKSISSKNPYFGYALDQTDGTFVWSITGTNYASGLAIGGGSGNLLYKGGVVLTANNVSSYALTSLSLAASGTRGGIQIGYSQNGKNYPVELSSEKAYVNVPWENTTYGYATATTPGLVRISVSGTTVNIITS